HFPVRRFRRYPVHRDVVVAAGQQHQFGGGGFIGLGEVTVIFQKTMDADHRLFGSTTVVAYRHGPLANPVDPSGKHFRIGTLDRFDQFTNVARFHNPSPPAVSDPSYDWLFAGRVLLLYRVVVLVVLALNTSFTPSQGQWSAWSRCRITHHYWLITISSFLISSIEGKG